MLTSSCHDDLTARWDGSVKGLNMKSLAIGAVALTLISVGANALAASPASEAKLARGEYLVGITGCNDCHTPRGPTGEFVPGRTLAGAPLGFTPIMKMPWAPQAPALAGGPAGYDEASLAAFLQSGKRKDGSLPTPPMSSIHMNAADAYAVARYIYSLKKPS
jgi:mono/diheme cytochrome c family protein